MKSSGHKKTWIFLLIVIAIAGFFYIYSVIKMKKTYAFFKPLDVLENFQNLPEVKAITDYGKKTIDKMSGKIKNQVSESAGSVANSISETVAKKTGGLKNSVFNFVKENINNGLDAVGDLLGVDIPQTATTTNQNCK